ncbi:hypothetical protein Rs2_23333 [Raphanus sativus]|nr:hypothetical protein Rs2_23333 [Raphanus sativus]
MAISPIQSLDNNESVNYFVLLCQIIHVNLAEERALEKLMLCNGDTWQEKLRRGSFNSLHRVFSSQLPQRRIGPRDVWRYVGRPHPLPNSYNRKTVPLLFTGQKAKALASETIIITNKEQRNMGSEGSGVSPMPAKGIEYSHVLKWLSYKLQCVCILFYSQEKETDEGKSGQQKRQCFILLPRVALSNSKINAHNQTSCVFFPDVQVTKIQNETV